VRIVAATNCGIEELIRTGRLKTDLFYRLNGHRIRLAPLRERRDEIRPLAERVLASCGIAGLTPSALHELQAYDWPGNVRELEMMVRVAACHAPAGGPLDLAHLPLRRPAAGNGTPAGDSLRTARAAWERTALIRALRDSGGVVSRAAKSLRLTRQAFYKAMRRTGLSPEDVRGVRRSRPSLNES
jgi:transcriptional regulator with PAS, ATPase and Fis domain